VRVVVGEISASTVIVAIAVAVTDIDDKEKA